MTLTEQKKQALELYVNQSFTQQQVADAVGVCIRTVRNWVKQHAWDRLRLATHQAPALIADNFSSQLVELQNNIASREPGKRIPTLQEMEIMRKLTVCIANTKKTVSLPQVTQMMRMFRSFVFDNRSKPYAQGVADLIDGFIEARSRFGYSPFELEFGVEKIQHIDTLYSPYVDTIAKETTEPIIPRFYEPPNTTPPPTSKRTHVIDTSTWTDEMLLAINKELSNHEAIKNMPPEQQQTYAELSQILKPVMESRLPKTNDSTPKTQETTSNEPFSSHSSAAKATDNLESMLTRIRKAFLQNHPVHPDYDEPKNNSKTASIPENETTLIINDLSAKTHENTGNKAAIQENLMFTTQPIKTKSNITTPFLENQPEPTDNTDSLPENETSLIINDLGAKTHEATGNKPEKPIDPLFVGYPTSSTPPDPTVPYTYFNGKMLLTKYPDGSIRYDYGGGRPAVTIKKGGPAILERRVFYI